MYKNINLENNLNSSTYKEVYIMARTQKISTGEKPGKGCYSCTNCGFDLRLDGNDKMPPCPNCNNTTFTKCN